jgi:ribonuclease R
VLKQAAGKPEAQIVNTLLLRSLKQARYSSENLGHFGLAFENYLHFTSPIRRYPDLVVHRVLRAMLQHRLSPTLKERLKSDFPKLAEQSSERERRAESAERELTRYYHARWAKDHVGEAFTGVVSGVTNFGVFVSLPNGVEGLMHVSHLDDDYYLFIEDALMLMGKSTRKRYRMGDRVEVKVYQANPTQRQIDLIPASMEMPEAEVEEKPVRQRPPKSLKAPAAILAEEAAGNGKAKGSSRRGKGKAAAKDAAAAKAPAKSDSAKADAPKTARKGRGAAAKKGAAEPAKDVTPAKGKGATEGGAKRSSRRGQRKGAETPAAATEEQPAAAAADGGTKTGRSRRRRGGKRAATPAATPAATRPPAQAPADAGKPVSGEKRGRRRKRLVFGGGD